MRLTLAGSVLICLLVAQLSFNEAGIVPAILKCRTLGCDLSRRVGGGGGGEGGGGKEDDAKGFGGTGTGSRGSNGGGNVSPQTDGSHVGEVGDCHTKKGWLETHSRKLQVEREDFISGRQSPT
ncbi:hypothetical protein DE146DRAFT_635848 [Phaeosphaeria sp. MPI-PUGE-AT-0046c]|nr:hypothetical protein DE146DRAFT_635848 [Phaeosphaeria sp. MPI-PUGE-AT-0046c]